MALPKYKMSRANTRTRRSTWKTGASATSRCSSCGHETLQNAACAFCGYWRGKTYQKAIKFKK